IAAGGLGLRLARRAGHRGHPGRDLLVGAEQQQRSADANAIADPEPADLDDIAVHAGAVGAFEIGQDYVAIVDLDLGMKPADALVVEAEEVAFLAPDRQGRCKVAENAALVYAFQDLNGYIRHRTTRDPSDA